MRLTDFLMCEIPLSLFVQSFFSSAFRQASLKKGPFSLLNALALLTTEPGKACDVNLSDIMAKNQNWGYA